MYEIEYAELALALVDHEYENERGVDAINHLGTLAEARVLNKVTHAVETLGHHAEQVLHDLLLLRDGHGRVELAHAYLAVVVYILPRRWL